MKYSYYEKHINKRTRNKYDVSTITSDKEVFQNLINDLAKPFKNTKFDKIVSQESLGFIIGSALAFKLKKGFIPIRKGSNLPTLRKYILKSSFVDYSKKNKSLEINKGTIKKGEKVLIVDDWIESGAQMKAAAKLIEKQGGKVVGISVIAAHKNNKTDSLFKRYKCHAINIIE